MQIFKNRSILKYTFALVVITGLAKILGYLEKVVLAYYYGTSYKVDVFILVSGVVISIFTLFRELIEPGFLTTFIKIRKDRGDEEAWLFFNTFGRLLLFLVVSLFFLGIAFPEKAISLFAPGFDPEKKQFAIKLLRVAFPALIFLCISNLTYITLNGHKNFILPAAGDVVFKGCIVICLVVLHPYYGIVGAAIGIVIGSVLKLFTHFIGIGNKITLRKGITNKGDMRDLWRLTWPLLIAQLFSQVNILFDNLFASYMNDGTIAALSYSKKIVEMPVVLFPYVLGIVVFPYFSQLSVEKEIEKLSALFFNTAGWIVFVFLPLSVFFFVFANPIVSALLERGAFNSSSTALTVRPFAVYSIGMTSFAIETILVLIFFAVSDTRTPTLIGILCVIVNLAITLLLIPHFGYLAIAIALVMSKSIKIIWLFYLLKNKIAFNLKRVFAFLTALIPAVLVCVIYLFVLHFGFSHYYPQFLQKKIFLLVVLVTGTGVYLLSCYLFKTNRFLSQNNHA